MKEMTCTCGVKYQAREADIKRGWGKSCSKSCASKKREKKTGNFSRFINRNNCKNDGHFVGMGEEDIQGGF